MKTRCYVVLAIICTCVLAESRPAFAQKLYPVKGPLAQQTPQPVFSGHIRRPVFSSAPLFLLLKSWTVANGEVLEGKPKKMKATSANTQAPSPGSIDLPEPNLAWAWDAVYGDGYFVARILGKEFGQGVFRGSKGTVLQVESDDGRNGVAVDNKGNVYKMVW
ncbi:MAG TPA: hypothetical protein VKB26_06865 [Candidatus Acidoferrales bacterium]|nr:hypothetical protein [Candidatus Acidoferrales bacterium]